MTASPTQDDRTLDYLVSGMSCGHCEASIRKSLSTVAGVEGVDVDLASKHVVVRGHGLEPAAVEAAIDEAGYEAVRS